MLFFGLWLTLSILSLILLPIVRGRMTRTMEMAKPVPTQGNMLLTNPRSAALISIVLLLVPVILFVLQTFGGLPLDGLLNGPNSEELYVFRVRVPIMFIAFALLLLPVAAGIIAGRPIVRTLQTGGSLFAHPLHLIIIIVISLPFAVGVVGLIVDQWPCFIGVPNCD